MKDLDLQWRFYEYLKDMAEYAKPVLSREEIFQQYGVTPQTIGNWEKKGLSAYNSKGIKASKGEGRVYRREDLMKFIRKEK